MLQSLKHIFLFFSSLIFLSGAFAQEKYRAVLWGVDDGLSMGSKNYMLKDAKGFLWVSTTSGINRFDGKTFKNYFIGFADYPLIEDSLHNIWIGTNDGISRYDIKADTFSNFKSYPDSNQGSSHCYPFQATKNEVYAVHIWSRTIYAFNIHTLEKMVLIKMEPTEPVNINNNPEHSIIYDEKTNSIWMQEGFEDKPGGGLLQISLSTGRREHYTWPCFKKISNHPHLSLGMCFDRKRNCLWLNTKDGLMQFTIDDKKFHHIDALNEWVNLKDYNFLSYSGIALDLHNRVWVSTYPKGIFIYDPATQSTSIPYDPNMENAFSEPSVSIYCDRDGIIWSSSGGIRQLISFSPAALHYDSKIFHSPIQNMVSADKGRIWVGGWSGLYSFDPVSGSVTMLKKGAVMGVGSNSNFPMMIDTIHQKAWIGIEPWGIDEMDISSLTYRPLIFKDISGADIIPENIPSWLSRPFRNGFLFVINGRGIFYVKGDSLVAQQILNIPQNIYSMVVADDKYLFLFCDGSVKYLSYTNKNDKWIRTANPLDSTGWANIFYNRVDQTYWVSTFNQLLFHYNPKFERLRSYTAKDGLPAQSFVQIVSDNTGNIWLANPEGVISQLNTKTGQITSLSEKDGYKKNYFGYACPFIKDANGDLYFAGYGGIDKVSPDKFTSAPPSSVYLQSLEVNQKAMALSIGVNNLQELSLKYFQNNINIETGIIDYYSKGSSRIRYKLERLNDNWQYAPNYYTIRYDGLQPGNYKLVMQASNATNEFNGPEKILTINVSPPFWQTNWFRILMGIVLVAMLYGIYLWRTATLRNQKKILEQTVKERTAEVVEEKVEVEKQKAKSDELLLNILPSEVAEELKEKGYTTAKSFDEVTVLFSDIKGFTNVAEKMTAQELVKEINTYFSAFDGIIQKFGLEKIKTIGDAYIAAGGLPEKNSATAQNVIEAAIAMQQAVEKLKQERVSKNKPFFELRIGIHTGPVVAGVVGIKKFQYDIWGDTVNLAARMEQSGVPGKINISQHTYSLVKDQFNCLHRGKIDAKNKGEIEMYFVE